MCLCKTERTHSRRPVEVALNSSRRLGSDGHFVLIERRLVLFVVVEPDWRREFGQSGGSHSSRRRLVVRDCGQSELKSLTKVALASVTGHPWIVFRIASGLAEVDKKSQ
jgi:hypothetical protein